MAEVGTAYLTIIPEMSGVKAKVTSALGGVDTSGIGSKWGSSAGDGFSGSLLGSGAIIGAASAVATKAFSAISDSIGSAVSRVDTMNNFPKVMTNLGYSSDSANTSIQEMSAHLDGLPTTLNDMTSNVQMFAASTGSLDTATGLGLSFNDAMLGAGASTASASNAMLQYNQMLSKGKVDQQSWNTLVMTAPAQMNQLAQSILGANANQSDLYAALQNGSVTLDQVNQAFIALDTQGASGFASFSQQAQDATQGIGTAAENMQSRVAKAVANVIQAIGASNIAGVINTFSSGFSGVSDVVVSVIGGIKAGFSDTGIETSISNIATSIGAMLPSLDDVKQGAQTFGNVVGSTLGNVAAVISGTIASPAVQEAAGALSSAFGGLSAAISGIGGSVSVSLPSINDVIGVLSGFVGGVGQGIALVMQGITTAVTSPEMQTALSYLQTAITNLQASLQPFYDGVLVPVGNALSQLGSAVLPVVGSAIGGIGEVVIEAIGAVINIITNVIQVITMVPGAFQSAGSMVTSAWQAVTDFFSGIPGAIGGFFSGIPDAIGGFFSDAGARVQSTWQGILDWFQGIPGQIGDFFASIPGDIADMFANIHVPSLHVDGSFNLDPTNFSLPSIGFYANGGIVTRPTLGMVGEGGEDEAITPISKLMPMISQAVKGASSSAKKTVNIYQTTNVIAADEDVYARSTVINRSLMSAAMQYV